LTAHDADALSIILEPDPAFPCAHVNLFFAAGPIFDPADRQGLTTLVNRALIRGTTRRSREALEEAVELLGAEMITATRNHAVSLGGPVLTRHLGAYLALLGEAITEAAFDPDEIEKVKREMRAELESAADEDDALVRMWFGRILYHDHPFGHGSAGRRKTLEAITAEDVVSHARRIYSRQNLLVGASGDLDEAGLRAVVDEALAGLGDSVAWDWRFPPIARPSGRRVVLIHRPDRGQARILTGHPSIRAADPDFFALHQAMNAFGGTFTSRLMQAVRVERGWSYGAHARISAERAGGTLMMHATPGREHAVDTLALLFDEFERFAADGLGDDELAFAREHLAKGFPFSVETAGLRAAHRVRARLLGRPDDYVDTWLERLLAPTPDDVKAAVQRQMRPDELVTLMVTTVDAELEAAVAALPGVTDVEVREAEVP